MSEAATTARTAHRAQRTAYAPAIVPAPQGRSTNIQHIRTRCAQSSVTVSSQANSRAPKSNRATNLSRRKQQALHKRRARRCVETGSTQRFAYGDGEVGRPLEGEGGRGAASARARR